MEADFYPLGMTNYPHFQQELHAGVNVLSLQRTTAFTLLNEAACCLLCTGVNRDFLLTQEIFFSGSTGNWRVCYEQNKPPEHSFGGTLYSFVLSTAFSRAIHCSPLCWQGAAKSMELCCTCRGEAAFPFPGMAGCNASISSARTADGFRRQSSIITPAETMNYAWDTHLKPGSLNERRKNLYTSFEQCRNQAYLKAMPDICKNQYEFLALGWVWKLLWWVNDLCTITVSNFRGTWS